MGINNGYNSLQSDLFSTVINVYLKSFNESETKDIFLKKLSQNSREIMDDMNCTVDNVVDIIRSEDFQKEKERLLILGFRGLHGGNIIPGKLRHYIKNNDFEGIKSYYVYAKNERELRVSRKINRVLSEKELIKETKKKNAKSLGKDFTDTDNQFDRNYTPPAGLLSKPKAAPSEEKEEKTDNNSLNYSQEDIDNILGGGDFDHEPISDEEKEKIERQAQQDIDIKLPDLDNLLEGEEDIEKILEHSTKSIEILIEKHSRIAAQKSGERMLDYSEKMNFKKAFTETDIKPTDENIKLFTKYYNDEIDKILNSN